MMKKLITFIALLACFMGVKAAEIVDAEVDFSKYTDISQVKLGGWGASDLAKARISIKDGCLHFHNEAVTDPTWGCQFYPIGGVVAEVGVTYTLHYKVKGSVKKNISALGFGQTPYGKFPITTEWVEGKIEYVAKTSEGDILFQCGDYVGDYDVAYLKITHEGEEPDPDGWNELIINGDFEGSDFSSFSYMAEVDGELAICDVTEDNLVADDNKTGHCLKVTSSETAKNYWDTQMYIKLGTTLAVGDKIKFSMRVKASESTLLTSQAQSEPGKGVHWTMLGDIDLTTTWLEFSKEITIDADHEGTQTIAFDLNKNLTKAIDFYFDDISVMIYPSGNTPPQPEPPVQDKDELIINGDFEGSDFSSFSYMAEVDGELAICDVTEDNLVADDNKTGHCLKVTSSETAKNYWDTQMYIKLGTTLAVGDKIKFSMRVKASESTLLTSQAQSEPGKGVHWTMLGDIDLTTTWLEFSKEITIDADHEGTQTIALDLNKNLTKAIDFYFDDISVKYYPSGSTPGDDPVDVEAVAYQFVDWTAEKEYNFWCSGDNGATATIETEGLAINTPKLGEDMWNPQTVILENAVLKKGHNYLVRIIAKTPADATIQVNMGNWDYNLQYKMDVDASTDFQEIDVEFPDYPYNCNGDAHITLQTGFLVGTSIIKKVEIYDLDLTEEEEVVDVTTNRIYVSKANVYQGYPSDIEVKMSNTHSFTAYQFELVLPEGFTLAKDGDGDYLVEKGDRYSDNTHQLNISKLDDNTYRIMCVSMRSSLISGTNGTILTMRVDAAQSVALGSYDAVIKNIKLTTPAEEEVIPEDITFPIELKKLVKGNANGDKDDEITVTDVVAIVNCVIGHPSSNFVRAAADMNDDLEIDIFDIIEVIKIVMSGNSNARAMARATRSALEQALVKATPDGILLDINDASRFTAFQFDVEVADGIELTGACLTGNAGSHRLQFIKNDQNTYRVVGMSMDNSVLTSDGNGLVELSLSKSGHVRIDNIIFATPQESSVRFGSGDAVVTGIASIESKQAKEIFDLSGRRINANGNGLTKGVYIINNKKVVIK